MTVPRPTATQPPPSTPPAWVRAVDLFCLCLAVLAVVVAMSGGFRVRVGGLRFALTSPYRLLIWAIVIEVVRHVAAPASPVYQDLPRRLAGWWRTPGVSSATAVVVGTRPAILFVGYLAVVMIGYAGGGPPLRVSDNELLNLSSRWDANWYLGIVTEGYSFKPNEPDLQQNIVFFPAYPLTVRVVGRLLGGTLVGFTLAGVLVSCAAFFGALIYLYALARDTLDDHQATYALWLIAAYPFALFFGAVYTEGLFLLAVAAAFYHFTRAEWVRASLWGLVVGLTRPPGCFLSIPLALMAIAPWLPREVMGGIHQPSAPRRSVVKALVTAAMPGVGVLLYAAYLWRLTGDPLAWVEGHVAWGRKYHGLAALVTDHYDFISRAGVSGYVATLPYDLLNALGVIFVLAAVWPVWRRLGLPYALFIVINILPPLSAGGLVSAGRFSSVLFPAFVWLAAVVPRPHRAGWIATFAAIQALNAALFYTWRPLY